VIFKNRPITRSGLFLFLVLACGSVLCAAPRLSLSQTAFTVSTVPGQNGASQVVFAANKGDGSLNLQASSSAPWLAATLGSGSSCQVTANCVTVTLALQTSSLAKGIFTGIVTLSDPNSIDAPQTITVTVQVGGAVPDKLEFFVPPNGSASSSQFITASNVKTSVTGGPWLSIAVDSASTFTFNVPYKITVAAQSGMAAADYNGNVAISGSSFAPDNKSVSVLLHVTTQPIFRSSQNTVAFKAVQGGKPQTATVGVTNGGQGTLSISSVTPATASGGGWLAAQAATDGSAISITVDPGTLVPNTYTGTVTIASNAANNNATLAVQFVVEAQTASVAFAGGAVNNGTFAGGEALAQGDIAAVFGDQFTLGDTLLATKVPLTDNLGGTQVFVNNQAAPLYFISNGQIDFQVPFETAPGPATVRVDRNGQRGNSIFVNIARVVPRFLVFNGVNGVITTPDSPPVLTGTSDHPVKVGDTIIIYSIGLGLTSPTVQTGAGAPTAPPFAQVSGVQACIALNNPVSLPFCGAADFAGLSPGFVGLYQVNFKIPAGVPSGDLRFYFVVGNLASNTVQLSIQ